MGSKGRGRHRLSLAGPVSLSEETLEVDWAKCIVCQSDSAEKLECPADNPIVSRRSTGYMTFAAKLNTLHNFNYLMPSKLRVQKLDNGTGYENTLSSNNAKWHKSCISAYRDVPRFQALLRRLQEEQEKVADATDEPLPAEPRTESIRQTRSAGVGPLHLKSNICFLCKSADTADNLHLCSTKEVHENIRESAKQVGDTDLLAILATADVIALEAKYHLKCLTKLYNKARRMSKKGHGPNIDVMCEGIAFSDLAAYIHRKAEEGKVMKLAQLVTMYQERLAQLLGVKVEELPYVHSTRFKERIQSQFPSIRADKEGRDIVLRHVSTSVLHNIHDEDQDEDALAVQRFFKSLRKTIFDSPTKFDGDMSRNRQKECVPSALVAVINLLMYGCTVTPDNAATQPSLSVAQLVMLNLHKKAPQGDLVRNARDLEAPFPLFLALSTYGRSRSRKAIDEMHRFGVSVSADRIMEVTSDLCHLVTERADEEGILCPSHLQAGRFTIGAYDNIDHNPTSRTAKGSFHGTSISIFQTGNEAGSERTLQTSYQNVAMKGRRSVPLLLKTMPKLSGLNVMSLEADWLHHVRERLDDVDHTEDLNVSWAAFHATKHLDAILPATNALLPLFETSSEDEEMMYHGMRLVRDLVNHLNKGQVPVLCVDQPLYKLARLIQWNSPSDGPLAENNFFVLLGPFHIEKAFLSVIGQFAENSGWKTVMRSSGIMTESAAESILKVYNVTKSRAAFQVTAAVLHSLLMDAYETTAENQTLEQWVTDSVMKYPTFRFWLTFLELILLLLQFVKSLRQSTFPLYVESFGEMIPWFFYFNHTHYARWGTVHYMELMELPVKIPSLYAEFLKGKFTVHKSTRAMSGLGVDQAHEQNNRIVKEEGGAIGLTQNPTALRRWMVAGPEVTNLLQYFRDEADDGEDLLSHHEQYRAFQLDFLSKCSNLKESFSTFSNPFLERLENLLALDTRLFSTKEGQDALVKAEQTGRALMHNFIDHRLCSSPKSLFDRIPKTKCHFFSTESLKKPAVDKVLEMKTDMQLFAKLYLNTKTLNLDRDEFFRYENQPFPPSLSVNGRLRGGEKHLLLHKLMQLAPKAAAPTSFDGIVFDGAAVVNYLPPRSSHTFQQYAEEEVLGYITSQASLLHAGRVDVVWDQYFEGSTKASTREERGVGIRRQKSLATASLPSNWQAFLRHSKNKEELFSFLASILVSYNSSDTRLKVLTNVAGVIRGNASVVSCLLGTSCACAAMEEADGRIILHVFDMVKAGLRDVLIRTVDTDVVVLAVSYYHQLQNQGLVTLWINFGTGANVKHFAAHELAQALGEEKAVALRGFHAFTGCDEVSFMAARGKKKAWNSWNSFPDVTKAFRSISHPLQEVPDNIFGLLEKFTIRLYDSKSKATDVNTVRKDLYDGVKTLSMIPPSKDSLRQHILRAAYQGGQIWGQAHLPEPTPADPTKWGWKKNGDTLQPMWSTLPDVWEKCQLKKKCHCKKMCTVSRCPCRITCTPCKVDCRCKGNCVDTSTSQLEEQEVDDPLDENGFPQ
ncbi:Cis-prenyltransferase 4, chloroplastic [Frankliniella fusca]|uniref:Cis-prenyltransferase 4, chloroplastic n=1 Tax=Frankliniella fusca TaxID=407009 RepID=A0AAE1GUX9_9NEOP|nr:Cis-prenyltransferase 4, chloroplastic [Frankliniella fusca]